ncbi:MAG: hypothetical protein SXA11_16580 [Cyanobacteriota bacterium]|nr:hypothetical protein [Cyanobacteriota bacterium]
MFAKVASLLTLIGAGLYYTGWIYRWAYFAFFQLEITTLDLPVESFLIVPLQVFFGNLYAGDFTTLKRTVGVAIATGILIPFVLGSLQFTSTKFSKIWNKWRWRSLQFIYRKKPKLVGIHRLIPELKPINYKNLLMDELVTIAAFLTALFILARHQGLLDASRDAFNQTSTLPVITLVTPENSLSLGRKLNDLTEDPPRTNFRIIGDLELYQELVKQDYNNKNDPYFPKTVWRLLIDRDHQFYIFPSLPTDSPTNARPPVVVVQESDRGEYLLILSPEPGPEPK